MRIQFTNPAYLLLLIPALVWVFWLGWKSDAQLSAGRRRAALAVRCVVVLCLIFALAGLQWLLPVEGMNVFYVLDRSDSVPSTQQESGREYINRVARLKHSPDKTGLIVFGSEASIETSPMLAINATKIDAVVGTDRTDLEAAIRLGTAAFPEKGQKRLVLLTDGNENTGDALTAALAAHEQLGVSIDVLPMGVSRENDVSVQKVQVPAKVKKGQVFDVKIFVQSDRATPAIVRLYRNDEQLGEQKVELAPGKNLFTFPQTLPDARFYSYDVRVEAPGDPLPQNNRAMAFANVQGEPRILVISAEPNQDKDLVEALKTSHLEIHSGGLNTFPVTLAEMQSYDAIFISNIAAGDLGTERQKLLESAVRDFGVGLICVGGDQTYVAGGYRGTPLENTLPVNMELGSKKVLPSGAVVLVMHGMEFAGGNQVARDCAQGVLAALGAGDEMGVVLWDGTERWLFPLQKVGDKKDLSRQIRGMTQGDLGSFQHVLEMGQDALKKSTSNLKHIIVFSDGDPAAPTAPLMDSIVGDRITVSTILIAGHVGPETMIWIADHGRGRFYNITSPSDLPQIFIKETAVILKSAIYEEPFKPQLRSFSEPVRGIAAAEYPTLFGYVATTPKPRAEIPLWTEKGDPLLAHWQYGLGRAVAFTSDAKARWGKNWIAWDKYRQFWTQIAQWSLRRLENADFTTEVNVEKGEGVLSVEAVDQKGEYRNFLNLQTTIVSPKGEKQDVRLEQTGPGHYEARFATRDVGSYLLNLMDVQDGAVRGSQAVGASVNYSPEFNASAPNLGLLRRIAESTGGKLLDPLEPALNPYSHDRRKTWQPLDFWQWLLRAAILLFVLDVGIRRIQLDREEISRALAVVRRKLGLAPRAVIKSQAEESLDALLARRNEVRAQRPSPATEGPRTDLFTPRNQPAPVEEVTEDPAAAGPAAGDQPPLVEPAEPEPKPADVKSRLLEAKRRAQKRRGE
jgi:uncharacterized membrane protein